MYRQAYSFRYPCNHFAETAWCEPRMPLWRDREPAVLAMAGFLTVIWPLWVLLTGLAKLFSKLVPDIRP